MRYTKRYYRLRTIVRVAFWTLLALGIWQVSMNFNWTGTGFCWGTIAECQVGGL